MKKEILRISYKYIFLLIIAAILCVGTVSARYSSSNSYSLGNNVGNFNYTFTVDGISATSFANVDYYASDGTTVNTGAAVRYISFSLESNESEVTADTTFYFSADYEFLSNIAFQIVSVGDDNTLTPVTPQYVMSELLDGDGVTDGYKDYGEIDYTGSYYKNLTVTNYNAANGTFTATATSNYGDLTISLTTDTTAHSVTYMYGRGPLREVAGETYVETDTSLNVYVESEESTNYSTLQISMPDFNMAPDSDKTFRFYFTTINKTELSGSEYSYAAIGNNSETYSVSDIKAYDNESLTGNPTNITITVDNSGNSPVYSYTNNGTTYELTQMSGTVYGNATAGVYFDLNSSISCVEYYYNVTNVYAYSDENCTADETKITVKVKKSATGTIYYYVSTSGDVELSQINSSTVYGNADESIYIDTGAGNFGIAGNYASTESYSIESEPMGIIYPMTLNILFAQSEQS